MKTPLTQRRTVLGIVAHHLLRVRAVVEMRQEAPIAVFAPPDSPLLEVADVCCPVPSLDLSLNEFDRAVEEAVQRGVKFGGILAMRDGNVFSAATACTRRGLPCPPLNSLESVRTKSAFRKWLDENGCGLGCRQVAWFLITEDTSFPKFCKEIKEFYTRVCSRNRSERTSLILKPDQGSCSQLILKIESVDPSELERAWKLVDLGRSFRNGRILVEECIVGREIAIDSIATGVSTHVFLTGYLPRDSEEFYTAGAVVPIYPPLSACQEDTTHKLSSSIHSKLGLYPAVTHMEMILPDDGGMPAIVEMNPRMGGGMLQEMHRLVSGVQMYRIAARLALGNVDIKDLLDSDDLSQSAAQQALIRFKRPGLGKMSIGRSAPALCHEFERIRFLQATNTDLSGGSSDDDLLAWCMLGAIAGEYADQAASYEALVARANELLFAWLPQSN